MHFPPPQLWRKWQRLWCRMCGERKLLTTFWPGDYRRDDICELEGQHYRVTRYFRAKQPDNRFYEVWGYLVEAPEPQAEVQTANQGGATLQRLTAKQR